MTIEPLSKQKNEKFVTEARRKICNPGRVARCGGSGYATRSAPLPIVVHTIKRLESACSFESIEA
jgi:hypothetical protein